MSETQRQAAPSKRSAASRLLNEPAGDRYATPKKFDAAVSAHPSGPLQSIARPSALAQLADRVAAGAMVTLVGQRLGKNINLAQHDAVVSSYWRAIDDAEATRGRLH